MIVVVVEECWFISKAPYSSTCSRNCDLGTSRQRMNIVTTQPRWIQFVYLFGLVKEHMVDILSSFKNLLHDLDFPLTCHQHQTSNTCGKIPHHSNLTILQILKCACSNPLSSFLARTFFFSCSLNFL